MVTVESILHKVNADNNTYSGISELGIKDFERLYSHLKDNKNKWVNHVVVYRVERILNDGRLGLFIKKYFAMSAIASAIRRVDLK